MILELSKRGPLKFLHDAEPESRDFFWTISIDVALEDHHTDTGRWIGMGSDL
jgi:hypothetical protein